MIPDQAGTGFESGDALDTCPPSGTLAGLAEALTRDGRLAELDDDELIEAIRVWLRLLSLARENRLAAVAELARRSALGAAPSLPESQTVQALPYYKV